MVKANSKLFLVLLLGVLSAFGPFVVDLYLPSLPQLASFFETSASMTQLTLTTAMIGLAVGQLLLGPLSDKFGRKILLIISLVIYIISTVLIVYAPNIEAMIVLRVIQGLSSTGSVVIHLHHFAHFHLVFDFRHFREIGIIHSTENLINKHFG